VEAEQVCTYITYKLIYRYTRYIDTVIVSTVYRFYLNKDLMIATGIQHIQKLLSWCLNKQTMPPGKQLPPV
jgi:hypothetical protein